MNRKYLLLVFSMIILFSACSGPERKTDTQIWEDGYNAGYSDGKFESDRNHGDDYSRGYEDGYSEASSQYDRYGYGDQDDNSSMLFDIELEARSYAGSGSCHDIESALDTVDAYLNGTVNHFGEWPTKSDFEEAVHYLYNYSDFYYTRRYAD